MSLHTAGHRRGVVCAPHSAAVEDGRAILAEGGNAIEAMLAMAASIAAVYPHMNHIGGDGFWLIREPSGRVRALMGAGRAGSKATLGSTATPATRDPDARAARRAHGAGRDRWLDAGAEAAKAHGGRLPLDVLLAPAIKHAREGYTVTRSQARLTARNTPNSRRARFCPGFSGRRQAAGGGRQAQAERFAATLEHLSTPGSANSIAAMSAARSPPIWSASAVR